MNNHGIERAVRHAYSGPIGGGTDEIMKEIWGDRWVCDTQKGGKNCIRS
jgi:hypothetical protein